VIEESAMFRSIADFHEVWEEESKSTLKTFRALTDASLSQAVRPGGRTLGRLAWHITMSLRDMMDEAKEPIPGPHGEDPQPPLPDIIKAYEAGSKALVDAVTKQWSDAKLLEKVPMYGEEWARGKVLGVLVLHQAHHRGQMGVLMRQAGLTVPGVYGPAYEEWAQYNMPAQL
jgi:uncharacterized damage-inducible protein DinB